MPVKFTTITEESLVAMEEAIRESCEYEESEFVSLFSQFRMYQENRLKINKDSRESKMAQRKEGGGGEGRSKSAKMTGVVKLVAIEGQENTFKVEKVSLPAPAPKPQTAEEEDNAPLVAKPKPKFVRKIAVEKEVNLAENPEALAAAVAEAAAARHPAKVAQREQVEALRKSEAERKKQEGIAKRKATNAAKKESLAAASKAALVANLKEDSGDETETDVESENDEE
jgi:hypothetical protein